MSLRCRVNPRALVHVALARAQRQLHLGEAAPLVDPQRDQHGGRLGQLAFQPVNLAAVQQLLSLLGSWLCVVAGRYGWMWQPYSQISSFSMRAKASSNWPWPSRRLLTSLPVRTRPASTFSTILYSFRALRLKSAAVARRPVERERPPHSLSTDRRRPMPACGQPRPPRMEAAKSTIRERVANATAAGGRTLLRSVANGGAAPYTAVVTRPRLLFVTGKLAEPALRRVLGRTRPAGRVRREVAVLPITVAALMTANWVARHLAVPPGIDRVVLPGFCRGDVGEVPDAARRPGRARAEGPARPAGVSSASRSGPPPGYGGVRHRDPRRDQPRPAADAGPNCSPPPGAIRDDGADVIDLGCDPGGTWAGVGDAVRRCATTGCASRSTASTRRGRAGPRRRGRAGAERQRHQPRRGAARLGRRSRRHPRHARRPGEPRPHGRVARTAAGVQFRIDPILEPIGFGFAASLGRYLEVRRRYPDAEMMMGVGNLTELTDVDSAGVNVLLRRRSARNSASAAC